LLSRLAIRRGLRSRIAVSVRRNRSGRVDAETDKAAGAGEFSPNTARFTASRSGDTVAHGEKGGLNFLCPRQQFF